MALAKLIESKTYTKLDQLDKTSSLNKHFLCDLCGRKEVKKAALVVHIRDCVAYRKCSWCNIVFKNRGNLVTHCLRMHGQNLCQKDNTSKSYTCEVCSKSYMQHTNLRFHVRKNHYNLTDRTFHGESRKVNDVWLEPVLNSDAVIEIRKTGLNRYSMKRVRNNTQNIPHKNSSDLTLLYPSTILMKRSNHKDPEELDLTVLYPTSLRRQRLWCHICQRTYYKKDFEKHLNERHRNLRQHKCNNCNKSFPRPYQYLRHKCARLPYNKKNFDGRKEKKIDCVTVDDD